MLPQVRVDDSELEAVRWLTQHLSKRDGKDYSMSDVIRLCVAQMYQRESERAVSGRRKR